MSETKPGSQTMEEFLSQPSVWETSLQRIRELDKQQYPAFKDYDSHEQRRFQGHFAGDPPSGRSDHRSLISLECTGSPDYYIEVNNMEHASTGLSPQNESLSQPQVWAKTIRQSRTIEISCGAR